MINGKNLVEVNCEELAKNVASEIDLNWIPNDIIRYRTFRCFRKKSEQKMDNGDILIHKELVGRVTVVTVPTDNTREIFAVDFAFCGSKEDYKKEIGKKLALQRLVDKAFAKDGITIIKSDFLSMTDTIRHFIVDEYSNSISWLHGVEVEDIR